MKANSEMIKKEEKGFIIIVMEIEEWGIISMMNQLEDMLILVNKEKFKLFIFNFWEIYLQEKYECYLLKLNYFF